MIPRINEAGLATVDLRFVNEVLLAAPGEQHSGIPICELNVLAAFANRSESNTYHQLVVVVDEPDSPETIARLRTKVTERMSNL